VIEQEGHSVRDTARFVGSYGSSVAAAAVERIPQKSYLCRSFGVTSE
jgi:hypothetical protein